MIPVGMREYSNMKRPPRCGGEVAFFVFELPTRFEVAIDYRYWQLGLGRPSITRLSPTSQHPSEKGT